jgi:hypothetical protein
VLAIKIRSDETVRGIALPSTTTERDNSLNILKLAMNADDITMFLREKADFERVLAAPSPSNPFLPPSPLYAAHGIISVSSRPPFFAMRVPPRMRQQKTTFCTKRESQPNKNRPNRPTLPSAFDRSPKKTEKRKIAILLKKPIRFLYYAVVIEKPQKTIRTTGKT